MKCTPFAPHKIILSKLHIIPIMVSQLWWHCSQYSVIKAFRAFSARKAFYFSIDDNLCFLDSVPVSKNYFCPWLWVHFNWPDSNRSLTGFQSLSVSCWMLWARDKQVNWIDNRIGDTVYIDNIWTLMKYEVTDIQVISPDDVDAIKIQDGRDLVTLLTCYPPNTGGRQRLLVFCERSEE